MTENYTYDSNGNRLTDDFGSYNYDASSQRLTEDYRYFYFYDQNGNISSKNSKTDSKVINYIHNSENQLVGIDYFDGVTPTKEISYVYDALGRRVKKTITDLVTPANSFTRKYVYDGNEILAEFDADNKLLVTYTHSTLRTDDVLAVDVTADGVTKNVAQSAQSYFYIKDGQGTVVDVVDSAGQKVQHHVYSSFGELRVVKDNLGNNISNSPVLAVFFSYTGREFDKESGLYHYRARTYDASIGRFLEEDPHPGNGSKPVTTNNRYVYSGNNSINFTDPNGKFFTSLFSTIGLGAILGGINEIAENNGVKFRSVVAGALTLFGGNLLTFGGYLGVRNNLSDKNADRFDKGIILIAAIAGSYGFATEPSAFTGLTGFETSQGVMAASALFSEGPLIDGLLDGGIGAFGGSLIFDSGSVTWPQVVGGSSVAAGGLVLFLEDNNRAIERRIKRHRDLIIGALGVKALTPVF
ncbi:MAG: RHS repeat-associated protein [Bacteriovoracaceae bacterium]